MPDSHLSHLSFCHTLLIAAQGSPPLLPPHYVTVLSPDGLVKSGWTGGIWVDWSSPGGLVESMWTGRVRVDWSSPGGLVESRWMAVFTWSSEVHVELSST